MIPEDAVGRSFAYKGEGVDDPEDINITNFQGESTLGIMIRWTGGEYEPEKCWIRAAPGAVDDLDAKL